MRQSVPKSKSPANFLDQCLVESDPAARAAGRRTRIASVGASLLLQAALLTLLVIVPLLAAGKLPTVKFDAPTPIFRGGDPYRPPIQQNDPGGNSNGSRRPNFDVSIRQPIEVPERTDVDYGPTPTHTVGRGCPGCVDIEGAVEPPSIGLDALHRPNLPDAPPPPAPRTPVKVHKDVMAARLIHRVTPVYPPLAKMTGRSGDVELRAIIGIDGRIHSLTVISGHPLLIEAAKQAVLQWRYQPTLLNGEPTEVDTFITVKFVLER